MGQTLQRAMTFIAGGVTTLAVASMFWFTVGSTSVSKNDTRIDYGTRMTTSSIAKPQDVFAKPLSALALQLEQRSLRGENQPALPSRGFSLPPTNEGYFPYVVAARQHPIDMQVIAFLEQRMWHTEEDKLTDERQAQWQQLFAHSLLSPQSLHEIGQALLAQNHSSTDLLVGKKAIVAAAEKAMAQLSALKPPADREEDIAAVQVLRQSYIPLQYEHEPKLVGRIYAELARWEPSGSKAQYRARARSMDQLAMQGRSAEAIAACDALDTDIQAGRFPTQSSKRFELQWAKGAFLFDMGRYEKAIPFLITASRIKGFQHRGNALALLVSSLSYLDRLDEAERYHKVWEVDYKATSPPQSDLNMRSALALAQLRRNSGYKSEQP